MILPYKKYIDIDLNKYIVIDFLLVCNTARFSTFLTILL